MGLIFVAMAQQSYGRALRQGLQKPKGEFLAVVFDRSVALVDRVALDELLAVTLAELTPANRPGLKLSQEFFTRPEVRHPNIILRTGQPAPAESRHQDTQSVLARFNPRKNRLCFYHRRLCHFIKTRPNR